jgi:ABC-2 type transport system permease protein
MNHSVSVIIPTCGRDSYFIPCLKSLSRQTCPPAEVILINNSLSAELEQKARELYPSIKILTPDRNLYYGESLNRGIAASTGDFILCLNDDATLDEDFIGEALKGFHADKTIGMVSGKILRPDRKILDTTGLFLSVWRTVRERGHGRTDRGQFEKEGFIFGVGGAVAFYRRKMLEEIKQGAFFFDPSFRMFYEDLDLSWRAHHRGWKAYYVPTATACHVRGGSVRNKPGQGKSWARRYLSDEFHSDLIKNRYRAISKNETFGTFCLHLVPMVFYDLCAWCYVLFFRPKVIRIFFSNMKGMSGTTEQEALLKAVAGHKGSDSGESEQDNNSGLDMTHCVLIERDGSEGAGSPLATFFKHREILWNLVRKNLKGKYAGSLLGILWAFINPLLLALIISFVFTKILKMDIENAYLFILAGMLPWTFFAGSLQEAVTSIPAHANLLKQFSILRGLIPLSAVLANFVLLLAGLLITIPFFIAVNPKAILMLPLLLAVLFLHLFFTAGLSVMVSAIYVSFRDMSQLLNVLLLFWLWLTPVFYSVSMIPQKYIGIFHLNPMTPYISLYRNALLYNGNASFGLLGIALLLSAIAGGVGFSVFHNSERDFLKKI